MLPQTTKHLPSAWMLRMCGAILLSAVALFAQDGSLDAQREELARLQLQLATTRDFASAEPALQALLLEVLQSGDDASERGGAGELLAEVQEARVNLLIDMGRLEEAKAALSTVSVSLDGLDGLDSLDAREVAAFVERLESLHDHSRLVALNDRVEKALARADRGNADLRSAVETALAENDWDSLRDLGSLAVPILMERLEPEAVLPSGDFSNRSRLTPLRALVYVEPERAPGLLSAAVPEPSTDFLRRVAATILNASIHEHRDAWVGCEDNLPQYAWVDWVPWFSAILRRAHEHEELAGAIRPMLQEFLKVDAVPPELQEAMIELVTQADVEAVSALGVSLEYYTQQSRSSSVTAESSFRELRTLDRLRQRLLHEPDARLRRVAANLNLARPDLGELRLLARDPDPAVRLRVALGFGDVRVFSVRGCFGSLSNRSESARPAALVLSGDAERLQDLARDPDGRVQRAAIAALATGRYGATPAALGRELWSNASSTLLSEMLNVDFAPEAAWLELLELAFTDPSPAVRLAAAERFGRGDTPSSVALVQQLVAADDPRLRSSAVAQVIQLDDVVLGRELLIELAGDTSDDVRAAVVARLDEIDDLPSLELVIDRLLLTDMERGGWLTVDWLSKQLQNLHTIRAPELLAELALREFLRNETPRIDLVQRATTSKKKSMPSDLLSHPAGLRLLALAAMGSGAPISDQDSLWASVLGDVDEKHFKRSAGQDPLLRDARWEAWKDLRPDQLGLLLDAYEFHGLDWLAIQILIDRLPLDRLEQLLNGRAPSDASWVGWRRLAASGSPAQQSRALDELAAFTLKRPTLTYAQDSYSPLRYLEARPRCEWFAARVRDGAELEELDLLVKGGMLGGLTTAGEMGGARRALVEAVMERWGETVLRNPEQLSGATMRYIVHLAASDTDLWPDDQILALAEDPIAWDSLWPLIEARRTDVYLPLLERIFLLDAGHTGADDALRMLRTYPSSLAEPLLLSLAERTGSSHRREQCLKELEQRSRVRAARSAFETRELEEDAQRRALQELLAMLDDADALVRTEATRALGTLGSSAQLPRLIRMLRDDEGAVREAAREAIEALHARAAAALSTELEAASPGSAEGG